MADAEKMTDGATPKRDAEGPPHTPPEAKRPAPDDGSAPQMISLSGTASAPTTGGLDAVLDAFKANFERELHGKLPGMMQASLAGLLGPMEQRQEALHADQQQLRREIGRMHEAHTKDSIDMRQQIKELTGAVRGLTHGASQSQAQGSAPHTTTSTATSAAPSGRSTGTRRGGAEEEVVLFQFPRPLTLKVADTWVRNFPEQIEAQAGRPKAWQTIDVHRYITAKFESAEAADAYARHAKTAKLAYILEGGGGELEINVLRRKRLPPDIERRGKALHAVYDLLKAREAKSLSRCTRRHGSRATQSFSLAMLPRTSFVLLLSSGGTATAPWSSWTGRNRTSG